MGVNIVSAEELLLSRGEATDILVKSLNLEQKNKVFLRDCDADVGSCLFAFMARTNFDSKLDPLILYPDVFPAYRYYKSINLATKLDVVTGFYLENESPYRPEQPITRIEALKMALGAIGKISWKERFELEGQEDSWLKWNLTDEFWWYGRYLSSALENGLIDIASQETADQPIGKEEFLTMMEKANLMVDSGQ